MGALLLGAVFAKVISTASNYLFSPATNLVNDVFVRYMAPGASNKRVLIVSRLAVVLLGCWALYQAVYAESILQKMLWAYTIYSAALTPVVLAAFYSKRVTAWGAVAAIAAGTVVTLAWDLPGVTPPASTPESAPRLPSPPGECDRNSVLVLSLSPIDFSVSKYCVTITNCITSRDDAPSTTFWNCSIETCNPSMIALR
jgi:Na+/proline symporter